MYPAVLLIYFISAAVILLAPLALIVRRFKVAILPLDLPRSGPVTHSGEILTAGKSHGKKTDRFSSNKAADTNSNH